MRKGGGRERGRDGEEDAGRGETEGGRKAGREVYSKQMYKGKDVVIQWKDVLDS